MMHLFDAMWITRLPDENVNGKPNGVK